MEKLHKTANLTNFKKKKLNYPYTIKIALIKRNQTEQYHFKNKSSAKTTYQNNSTSKFHRQIALNTQLSQRKDDQKTKQETATIKRKLHTSIPKRRNSSKLRIITSISL